jgi:hypothetical protein
MQKHLIHVCPTFLFIIIQALSICTLQNENRHHLVRIKLLALMVLHDLHSCILRDKILPGQIRNYCLQEQLKRMIHFCYLVYPLHATVISR